MNQQFTLQRLHLSESKIGVYYSRAYWLPTPMRFETLNGHFQLAHPAHYLNYSSHH